MSRKTGVYIEPRRRAAGEDMSRCLQLAALVEKLGVDSIWMSQIVDAEDSCTLLAAYAPATERVGLGVAAIPIYLRHPVSTVQMAATLDELSGGRFRLGLGTGSELTVEWILGLQRGRPLAAMREYVSIVRAGLETGQVSCQGRHFSARWKYAGPPRPNVPVMIGAMGPRMLELAGEIADGVMLWMCTPAYIRDVVMPHVTAGRSRSRSARDRFEIQACVYVGLTSNHGQARSYIRQLLEHYVKVPTYGRIFAAMGFADDVRRGVVSDALIDEISAIGDELEVRCALESFRDAGCTLPTLAVLPQHDGSADFVTTLQVALT